MFHLIPMNPQGLGDPAHGQRSEYQQGEEDQFDENRRFIRCDQFPASRLNFLARLSKVIGAGIEIPEDLTPLQPSLSSNDIILFLDNVESIVDPQGTDRAREIYTLVGELSRFEDIYLGITSRVSQHVGLRPTCQRMGYSPGASASDGFQESLAATIELSLASPTFRKLGSDAHGGEDGCRDILGPSSHINRRRSLYRQSSTDVIFPTSNPTSGTISKTTTQSVGVRP